MPFTAQLLTAGRIEAGRPGQMGRVAYNNHIKRTKQLNLESLRIAFTSDGQKLILLDPKVHIFATSTYTQGTLEIFVKDSPGG